MRHLGIYLLLAGLSVGTVRAQIGGRHVYDFLNLPVSARQAALGGINVSSQDDDLLMAAQNPAAVNPSMHGRAGLTYSGYLAGIRYGFTAYSRTWEKIGSFYTGIQYLTSGEMQGADELGNLTETFSAGEFAWVTGYSRAWRQFRYGGSLKLISSSLAPGFTSLGIAADLGGSYKSKSELFVAGLVVRNAGLQLTTYTGTGAREPLPFEIVAGVSNKLKYMPLRFSITATNLDQPRLIYRDPNPEPEYDLSGNLIEPKSQFSELIFRHFVFSTEFLLGDFLRLRAGYNHLRRQELRAVNRGGMTGFSLGAGIRAGRLALDYGFSSYGLSSAFSTHQVSLGLGLTRPEQTK
ncbi:MAG: type IX secretion system protein PorQ [Bacteroidia bacterium]|nr:type IX secretion system protein PorQ [Bacteroidia bacterium]